ncbi:uncharacterized protein TNIN_219001 [Trichonephila inaurata madagascariensis]|uniref:Uncharacterized protein n=1 Tax=Trichonephila inaurata madagascariensis TaxID=2747483 RepID=A0A8X6XHG1_9ARAC|nr:uncharacterized protein TNIN_219001 [Trichonephila inaurata madagascariensis]
MVIFTCIFVFLTVILSGLSTVFLTFSLLSNEWEYLTYKTGEVEELSRLKNHTLQWLPHDLGRLEIPEDQVEATVTVKTNNKVAVYLIPAFGGVNNLCPNITGQCVVLLIL